MTVRDAVELLLQAEHELRADAASDLRNRLESSRRELHKIGDELAELADT